MATTSRPCTIDGCRSPSRTVCICCEKCYCLDHLTKHFGRINNRVPTLADKINALSRRLTKFISFDPAYLVALEKWRDEAHQTVEHYYETKRRDFVDDRREKLKKEIERVRHLMDKLMRKNDALKDDVDLLTQDIKLIEQKISEFQTLRFIIHPLVIDDNLIIRDLLPFSSPCRTMKLPLNEYSSIANNDKLLLVHQPPNISLLDRHFSIVKQTPWTHENIWDMTWSTTLSRFILVTETEIFTLDPNTMNLAKSSITSSDTSWSRVTCSETNLYLLTQGLGPSIFEYKLPLSNKGGKQRQPPETCEESEHIFDLKSSQQLLAMVVHNTEKDKTRLDLRSSNNFTHLWTVEAGRGFRCCSLYGGHWMVVDPLNHRFIHISNDGKLIKSERYTYQPWNIIQWGKYIIGIRTTDAINLH